jgi:hypothetical protein
MADRSGKRVMVKAALVFFYLALRKLSQVKGLPEVES